MALQHAPLPELLLTDCDSVRLGTIQPAAWAGSAKRRLAKIWSVINIQLDDTRDLVHWMPAHTSESSIGQKLCSDGYTVSEVRWCGNQVADILAKEAAESCRVCGEARSKLMFHEKQLLDLAIFLGKLTHAANAHVLPDGTKLRDSQANGKLAGRRKNPKRKSPIKAIRVPEVPASKRIKAFSSDDWIHAWRRSHATRPQPQEGISRMVRVRRATESHNQRQEAAFRDWWRESRSQSLQPRPADAPTATQRLEALRSRVAARSHNAS
jgi:hypothetical protein